MLDFDGNIIIPISLLLSVVVGLLFWAIPWKTVFDKILKLFLGLCFLGLLGFATFSYFLDLKRLEGIKMDFEKGVVGIYLLDKNDSYFNESLALPDMKDGIYRVTQVRSVEKRTK